MKLIIGLGNPGRAYEATPHNLGFAVADLLARRHGLKFRDVERFRARVADGRIRHCPIRLVKPQTFMNLSGDSVAALTRQCESGSEDLLVIADDVSLPIGRLRIRERGSHGGHNGLRSIVERFGSGEFSRLRIGIRPPWEVEDLVAFVLQRLPPEQRRELEQMTELAADAVEMWVADGTARTAERYNGLQPLGRGEQDGPAK